MNGRKYWAGWLKICLPFFVSLLLSGCTVTGGEMIKAAYDGDRATLSRLLDQGQAVDERGGCGLADIGGDSGVTPLLCAAHNGHMDAVKLLLEKGADVNAQGKLFRRTPLTAAVYARHAGIVKLLIDEGADVDHALARLAKNDPEGYQFLENIVEKQQLAPPPAPVIVQRPARPSVRSDVDEPPASAATRNRNAFAIVVGIERYRQQLPPADFAARDAEMVSAYLTKSLGYPGEQVVTLTNDHAALGDFVKYFEKWLPNNVEPGGTVFIYYSGHGAPNPKTGDAYLVPYDGDPAFIDETGYSLKRMYAALGKLPAKNIVVALDSCFSGAGGRSVIAPGTRSITLSLKEQAPLPRNLTVLAASSGEQTSSTYADKGHGLFTYFLLKGIKNEDVVATDGSLRLDDLFAYLGPQVERVARKQFNNEQTPQLLGPGR